MFLCLFISFLCLFLVSWAILIYQRKKNLFFSCGNSNLVKDVVFLNCRLIVRLYSKLKFWMKKKMVCEYEEMTQQQFNKKICHFKSRHELYFSLMNTLLQIKFDRWQYCLCDTLKNEEKCQLFVISTFFCDFERDLNNNILNAPYLQNYQSKLYPYFSKSFYINKESICCFLDKEYSYGVRDRSGRVYFIFLS